MFKGLGTDTSTFAVVFNREQQCSHSLTVFSPNSNHIPVAAQLVTSSVLRVDMNPHWRFDNTLVHVEEKTLSLWFDRPGKLMLQLGEGKKLNMTIQLDDINRSAIDAFSLDGSTAAMQAAYQACAGV